MLIRVEKNQVAFPTIFGEDVLNGGPGLQHDILEFIGLKHRTEEAKTLDFNLLIQGEHGLLNQCLFLEQDTG